MNNKAIVVYYSLEGSTKLIAENLALILDADLLELKPFKEIGTRGFTRYLWGGRQVVFKDKPKLKNFSTNFKDYDVVIIGTPVWAFTFAPPIRSFLSKVKLEGKKIGIFCCHEGWKGKTNENMKKMLPNNEFIEDCDFLGVARNKDRNIKKAEAWALKMKEIQESA